MANVKSTRYYEDYSAKQTAAQSVTPNEESTEAASEEYAQLQAQLSAGPNTETQPQTQTPSAPDRDFQGNPQMNNTTQTPIMQSNEPITAEPANPGGALSYTNENDTFAPENSQGEILVQALTSRGTRPIPEAAIVITAEKNGNREPVAEVFTNKDGRTPLIFVPAPSAIDSQTPTDTLPFADYNITVTHPLYYTAEIKSVQVFGDQLTIQTVEMIPLPEFVNENNTTRTVDIPKQNL